MIFGKPLRTVEIVYKSGHVRRIQCVDWEASWNNNTGQFTSIRIAGRKSEFKDASVAFGIHNIESIWEL